MHFFTRARVMTFFCVLQLQNMRGIVLCIGCLLFFPLSSQAYYYNDSEVIEVGDGVPKNVVTDGTPVVTEGGYIIIPPNSETDEDDQVVPVTVEENTTPTPVVPLTTTEDGYLDETETDISQAPTLVTDAEAFDILLAGGAIIGEGLLKIGNFFEDSLLSSFGQGAFGGGGSLFVYGTKVRDSMRSFRNLQDALEAWRRGQTGALTERGYALIAASTALRDGNVQYVTFSAAAFELTYRSRGYLLSIFPVSFPVRIEVIPEASVDRVKVKLPWYRFFVREFFTPKSLATEIDAVLNGEIEKNTKPESDLKAVLFEAVARFLHAKVGTISDSIFLGTPLK